MSNPPKEAVLKSYTVQGWYLDNDIARLPVKHPKRKISRHAMRIMVIEAPHAMNAALIYATANNIIKKWWNDGSESPNVCIRVS